MVVSIRQTVQFSSLSLSLQTKNWQGGGTGDGFESGVGGGVGLLERVIFFSSGVKGGRSCVQSS